MNDPYIETSYQCSLISLRVAQRGASLDELLRCNGQSEWTFITAWNPHGNTDSVENNERNNQLLLLDLQKQGHIIIPGWGIGDDRRWPPEASFLVLGINKEQAISLAKRYKQRAIVCGSIGQVASLHYIEEKS